MPSPENRTTASSITEAVSQMIEEGSTGALATLVAGAPGVGAKLLVSNSRDARSIGSLGDEALDRCVVRQALQFIESNETTRVFQVKEFSASLAEWEDAQILFERLQPPVRLVICGAGHVGAALAKLAGVAGYQATLIDDRDEFVKPEDFPEDKIELVAAKNWFTAVQAAVGNGHGVSVAVVTRGHSEDEQCLRAVVETGADYIGLIGSKRRTNIVLQRLREYGADERKLAQVRAPVGLDIGAVTPEEVALAILAEIVAVRRGGEGGSLSAWRRKQKGKGNG